MNIPSFLWPRALCLVLALSMPWFFGACTARPIQSGSSAYVAASGAMQGSSSYLPDDSLEAPAVARGARPSARPGLATGTGHQRLSVVEDVTFHRKNSAPDGLARFFYNDEAGAKAMAEMRGKAVKKSGWMELGGDRLKVALVPLYGRAPYPRYETDGESIIIAEANAHYVVHLKNQTNRRLETVVSVDGPNVLDGQPAGTTQRGYILEPRQELEIEGFRVNNTRVKTFRFGSVGDSVAASKGATRNVGVIGVAVYEEDLVRVLEDLSRERDKRLDSDAFPVSRQ